MILDRKELEDITEEDLQQLLDDPERESKTVEYKRDRLGDSVDERREFLYDVSSLANTAGGYLILGVDEDKGLPTDLCGIEIDDFDKESLKLNGLIRDGITPRIPSIETHPVPLSNGKIAIVIRIAKSWTAPHMVTLKGVSRFYARHSTGKHPMDFGEIKSAFLLSETRVERIRNFRNERINLLVSGEPPASVGSGAKLILHIVPLQAFEPSKGFDASYLKELTPGPLGSGGWDGRYNLDGYLTFSQGRNNSACDGYVQLFRSGILEIVDLSLLKPWSTGDLFVRTSYEEEILKAFPGWLNSQKTLGVEPPLVVMLSFVNVRGYRMAYETSSAYRRYVIDRANLLIPEIIVDSYEDRLEKLMKPAFDTVWNAAGLDRSYNYDENGNWTKATIRR